MDDPSIRMERYTRASTESTLGGAGRSPAPEFSLDFRRAQLDGRRQVMEPVTAFVEETFAAETRRLMARRVPLGALFFMGVVAVAGLVELTYYPNRLGAFAACFNAELVLCAAAVMASRSARLLPRITPVSVVTTLGVAACITAYVVVSGASGDALVPALIIFLTGVALMFPWGTSGQLPLVGGTLIAYLLALWSGVRGDLPLPYGVLSVGGGAVTSIAGAALLDRHRRSIFHQRILLERARDQQMAMLYEVTRTVTATLELPRVLRLVGESLLDAFGMERLWLFWRGAPTDEVHGLATARRDGGVAVEELADDAGRWVALLETGASAGPTLRPPQPAEAAALAGAVPPDRLLHLPLSFQSELVGVVLADAGPDVTRPASFLELAATLGNSAAMAIGNARLHALVLQHRADLQRLSKGGLAQVEEVMRRISRELHDNTCQALTAIKMDLGLLERQLGGEASAFRRAVRDVRAQVLGVIHDVREMSHLIHPPVLADFGALAAMESTAAKYQAIMPLEVRVTSSDPGLRFEPAIELLLFRIFQEALMNVVKHAGATRVAVEVRLEGEGVHLLIEDDGRGFDASAYLRSPPPSAGLGLLGMRERVAHFGGTFRVASHAGGGTRISVRVPAVPRPAATEIATAV
jgi:signal transduction histidine kinase